MKLGIFGGSFDPIHLGHLILAERCREECELDQVWFVPAGQPPHKAGASLTPGGTRAEMIELAIAGHHQFSVNRMELNRTGRSFTVDTLHEIHSERPDDELFFLIGADSLSDLPQWREPSRIAELAIIVAVNRGDDPLPDLTRLGEQLSESIVQRIRVVHIPGISISATEIRDRVRNRRSIRYTVPRAVQVYIEQHQLYAE